MTAGLPEQASSFGAAMTSKFRLFLFASVAACAVIACGGQDPSTDTTTSSSDPAAAGGTNRSPSIAGSPSNSVMQGTQYSFVPTASDADGDVLTFSISGKPSWATFSTANGTLQGTPGSGDVGTYSNIVISVTDGSSTVALASFSINVVSTATGSATLSWQPPTQNDDGTPLTDLSGYRLYWSQTQGSYSQSVTLTNPGLTSYVVDQLTPATWFFVITAVNSQGVESSYSNVASKTVM